jgi:hypothetical protein
MKATLQSAFWLGLWMLAASGCYTTTLRSGLTAAPATLEYDSRWHHGVFWGIAEISGPYDLSEVCPQGWAEIKTETSFLNGLLYSLSGSLYAPQTVTIHCAPSEGDEETGEAENSEDSEEESEE